MGRLYRKVLLTLHIAQAPLSYRCHLLAIQMPLNYCCHLLEMIGNQRRWDNRSSQAVQASVPERLGHLTRHIHRSLFGGQRGN